MLFLNVCIFRFLDLCFAILISSIKPGILFVIRVFSSTCCTVWSCYAVIMCSFPSKIFAFYLIVNLCFPLSPYYVFWISLIYCSGSLLFAVFTSFRTTKSYLVLYLFSVFFTFNLTLILFTSNEWSHVVHLSLYIHF